MKQTNQAVVDGVRGTAQVVSVGVTAGAMNMDPILPVDLLATPEGGAPRPVSLELVVPVAHLYRGVPGATLPVRVGSTGPSAVAIDWEAPTP